MIFQRAKNGLLRSRRILWTLIAAAAATPILLLAYGSGAPAGYAGAPTSTIDHGNCTACHNSAKLNPAGGSVTVTGFDSGNTYTPGITQHLTATVSSSGSGKGFELTARLASSTTTQEGNLVVTDAANTAIVTGGGVQFITHTGSGSSSWKFDWTPPSSAVGDIVFYVAGVSGFSNAVYTNSYTLSPAAAVVVPTLSVNPTSLTFSYESGSSTTPSSQTFTVSSGGGTPVSFSAGTTGGSWLSVAPLSGTTGTAGTLTVSVDPSALAVGTYTGSVTISSTGASNSPSVGVTLNVTAPPSTALPSLSVSSTSLSFNRRGTAKTIQVTSSGAAIEYSLTSNTVAGEPTWLSASCSEDPCTAPDAVMVTVNTSGLSAGAHSGSIALKPADPAISPVTIAVKVRVPKH